MSASAGTGKVSDRRKGRDASGRPSSVATL